MSAAALIAIDWGTSSFRASLLDRDGAALDRIDAAEGIRAVPDRNFDTAFHRLLGPWIERHPVPILASGMITSRNGWIETPYLGLPAGARELAGALARHETRGTLLHFVTGLADDRPGRAPEIMRGEETEIVGALASGSGDGLFVLPGTHSKWATVAESRVTGFATYMTGEIHAALRGHTILGALMQPGPFAEDALLRGVEQGLSAGPALLNRLFHVRTLTLFGRLAPEEASDFLSGLLIGSEIAAALDVASADAPVTLVGRSDLASRYETALKAAGRPCRRAAPDLAARGLLEIARMAELLK